MKIALVYDRVNKIGGAERVLETLHEIWPKAPLYTAVYYPAGAPWAKNFKVMPSFLNKWPLAKKHHELYPWLTPLAFESFDFSDFHDQRRGKRGCHQAENKTPLLLFDPDPLPLERL